MTLDWDNPLDSPDPVPCPAACGWLTDDPYGGPCSDCWAELELDRAPRLFAAQRFCDAGCMDVYPPARPVVTVDLLGALCPRI